MAVQYEYQSREWLRQIDSRFLENPVSAYLILKRLSQGWIQIESIMRENWADGKYF